MLTHQYIDKFCLPISIKSMFSGYWTFNSYHILFRIASAINMTDNFSNQGKETILSEFSSLFIHNIIYGIFQSQFEIWVYVQFFYFYSNLRYILLYQN